MQPVRIYSRLMKRAVMGNMDNEFSFEIVEGEDEARKVAERLKDKEIVAERIGNFFGFSDKIHESEMLDNLQRRAYTLPLHNLHDLLNINTSQAEWLIDGLIYNKDLVILAGKRASFKTWTAMTLAIAITKGEQWLSKFPTKKAEILILDEENGEVILRDRYAKLSGDFEVKGFHYLSFAGIKLDDDEWYTKLVKTLEAYPEIKLIIIDSFRRVSGIDENVAGEISKFLTTRLRPLIVGFNLTIILIHHVRKGLGKSPMDEMDEIRGSSDLANYADTILLIERPRGSSDRIILKQLKSRHSLEMPPQLIEISWGDGNNQKVSFNCVGTAEEALNDADRCALQILAWLEEHEMKDYETKEFKEAMNTYKYGKKTVDRALGILLEQKKIIKVKKGVWQLPLGSQTQITENPIK